MGWDVSGYHEDESWAGLGLWSRLARLTDDPQWLDWLFRLPGLYRPKRERADYQGRTIAWVLGLTTADGV